MNEVPSFNLEPDLETSSINKLYGTKLTAQELAAAKENLARLLKLLVRIDRRIRNEEKYENN